MLFIRENMQHLFQGEKTINDFLAIEGDVYRNPVPSRKTSRFERQGQGFFIKAHWGIGWQEIFKNLVYLRLPVLGAGNEVRAIKKLESLGIDTMAIVAHGESGCNPAARKSFLITEELTNTKQLDHWIEQDFQQLDSKSQIQIKRKLISRLAGITKNLHEHGVNHRDYYLCHFLASLPITSATAANELKLYLIDLHRAQIRSKTPQRWLIKDLAGLYFSSMDMGMTNRDYLRFIKIYTGKPLRTTFNLNAGFWGKVADRATRLYKKQHNHNQVKII
jgi:hypothetical protein